MTSDDSFRRHLAELRSHLRDANQEHLRQWEIITASHPRSRPSSVDLPTPSQRLPGSVGALKKAFVGLLTAFCVALTWYLQSLMQRPTAPPPAPTQPSSAQTTSPR